MVGNGARRRTGCMVESGACSCHWEKEWWESRNHKNITVFFPEDVIYSEIDYQRQINNEGKMTKIRLWKKVQWCYEDLKSDIQQQIWGHEITWLIWHVKDVMVLWACNKKPVCWSLGVWHELEDLVLGSALWFLCFYSWLEHMGHVF